MKKNNTAEKTILDAEKIAAALKEGTEKSLSNIMNEAISKLVMEADENDYEDETEDDSYEVEDVETNDVDSSDEVSLEGGEEATEDGEDAGEEGGEEASVDSADDAEDDWSDMDKYKVGDNDYDFTSMEGEDLIKVYNKLDDDDKIFVKKEDDGVYSFKDDETGSEFVIELDPNALDGEADDTEDGEIEIELDNEGEDEGFDFGTDADAEGEEEILDVDFGDDDDELNEENLGYTDSYQDDVFAKKFNMNEPANSSATYSMDAGAPKGNTKPWAGKHTEKDYHRVDEAGLELRKSSKSTSGTRAPKGHDEYMAGGSHNVHDGSESGKTITESVLKIVNKAKEIQEENKQYKKCINEIKKSLYEAAVLNVNLGKLVNLLVNETATSDEKKSICERFNNVKTIAEGKTLYKTIKMELNESKTKSAPIVERQMAADANRVLNETTIYANNTQDNECLDLMNRMDNLFKK